MKLFDLLIALLIMMIWGFNFVVAKWGLAYMPPIFLMALRFAAVAAILLPFARIPRAKLREIFFLSVTLGCVHFSLMFMGLTGVNAGAAAIAIQLQVPFAAILAAIFFGDKLGWRRALGMAAAFAGIVVLAGEPRLTGHTGSLLLVIAASFMWAVTNIQIKHMGSVDGFALSAWMSLFAVPQLLIVSALLESGQIEALLHIAWPAAGVILYMAVIVTVVSYGMWYHLLRNYSVNQAMPFTLLVPVFGVMSGVLLLDEPFTWRLVAGGLATLAGVGIIVVRRPRLAEPEATAKTT
ncbi:MAG: EamA family transporter [Rhodospirillales bacterium]|nr:EamA family transporter [Rhodospirillales bacterium]